MAPEARTNTEWLDDLRDSDGRQDQALEDLRVLLATGLRRGLLRRARGDFRDLAEGFVQDALLKILSGLDGFRSESRFTTWAHKVCVRVALTELRRKRWRDVSLDDLATTSDGYSLLAVLADGSDGPQRLADQADLTAKVRHYIQEELTERQRLAVLATAVRGMPLEEVARRMGSNRNALYKLLHDARKKLKSCMLRDGMSAGDILMIFTLLGLE